MPPELWPEEHLGWADFRDVGRRSMHAEAYTQTVGDAPD